MSQFESLFGAKLRTPSGDEVATAEKLAEVEAVGVYFSAHWCPPCRGFTPELAKTYNKLKEAGKKFEIVFASSDRDEDAFKEYHGEMPWLALPYAERKMKETLSKKYKVSGIPTFVILDKDGNTITTDGREDVSSDPEGKRFPWNPPTFADCVPAELQGKDGATVKWDDLKDKVIGLYFSAHWCPPCKAFTPKLAECYNKLKADGKNLEIIFVSSDKDQAQFDEYYADMPWLALPFPDRERKATLSKRFGVQGIPTLVFLNHDGTVINANGRGAVGADPEGKEFPWYPKPVNDLDSPDGINETTSVVVLCDGCNDATKTRINDALTAIAKPIADSAKEAGADMDPLFFIGTKAEGVTSRVRGLVSAGEATTTPQAFIVDIPDSGGYYAMEGDVTKESLEKFLADYKAGSLTRKQLA